MTSSQTHKPQFPSIPCSLLHKDKVSLWGKCLWRRVVSAGSCQRLWFLLKFVTRSLFRFFLVAGRFQAERVEQWKSSGQMEPSFMDIRSMWTTRDVSMRVHSGYRCLSLRARMTKRDKIMVERYFKKGKREWKFQWAHINKSQTQYLHMTKAIYQEQCRV